MSNQEYTPHLYMICYPNAALVLSHLSPEQFGIHYNYGSTSYYAGKLIFAEIDINYRCDFFDIETALQKLKPHSDGRPKATKYIASYRVLEHIDIDAVQTLYIANADGSCYPLPPGEYQEKTIENDMRIFAEITPTRTLVLSKYTMREFGKELTTSNTGVSVPRMLYLQICFDVDDFLRQFEANPFMVSPIEGVHPSKLRDAIVSLRRRHKKFFKSLTLETAFKKESYRKIKNGFMLIDGEKEKFFPMPSLSEIEANNLHFWKSM